MFWCVHNVKCVHSVSVTKTVFIVHCVYWVCVCVFCTLSSVQSVNMYCLYVNCFCFFALFGARSQEFHSPRHLRCGDVTIKVIWFDLIYLMHSLTWQPSATTKPWLMFWYSWRMCRLFNISLFLWDQNTFELRLLQELLQKQRQLADKMWPWTTKPVIGSMCIFVAIANNTLYGSKLSIFLLCQKFEY